MITVISIEQDMAGKWRAALSCDDVRREFKFQSEPSEWEAIAEAERVLALEAANRAQEIADLEQARRQRVVAEYEALMGQSDGPA